ncbi:MAG TPA: GNAT family N-acetyltransferase [Gaiellaceae bacterium]|nr:GNAT family N-acetyltransferase [Gaiellaceae bacterium]
MGPVLRDVVDDDIEVFFEHQNDPEAVRMAVFPPRERDAFYGHWRRILRDEDALAKTIVSGDDVAGNIGSWSRDGRRFVGYWLGREFWGRGLATKALAEFVPDLEKPIYAEVATTNPASIRVLEKCGFMVVGSTTEQDKAFGEIELLVMKLVG